MRVRYHWIWTIFWLLASTAVALASEPFQLSSTTSADSALEIQGQMNTDQATWIWFHVTKDGSSQKTDSFLKNDGSKIDRNVYLEFGPGNYTVAVLSQTSPNQYAQYNWVTTFHVTNTDTRDLSFLFPSDAVQSDSPVIIALADRLTAGVSNPLDRASAIHDWVAKHIVYDLTLAREYPNGGIFPQSALLTLQSGRAVCQGYSDLIAALNRAAGIPTKIVTGVGVFLGGSGPHAWNEFQVGGKWLSEDATWDSGFVDADTQKYVPAFSREYFDPDPAKFAQDHLAQAVSTD